MKIPFLRFLVVGLLAATAAASDDAKDEAVKKDRKRIKGTWKIVELTVNGNQVAEADAAKLSVVNGSDGSWKLRSGDKQIAKGTSTIDPTLNPKTIDFKLTDGGGKGTYLGIYKLGENRRSLCFAPPAAERPKEFSSASGSGHVLVVFERVKTE